MPGHEAGRSGGWFGMVLFRGWAQYLKTVLARPPTQWKCRLDFKARLPQWSATVLSICSEGMFLQTRVQELLPLRKVVYIRYATHTLWVQLTLNC